jgi:hypothetical protein
VPLTRRRRARASSHRLAWACRPRGAEVTLRVAWSLLPDVEWLPARKGIRGLAWPLEVHQTPGLPWNGGPASYGQRAHSSGGRHSRNRWRLALRP